MGSKHEAVTRSTSAVSVENQSGTRRTLLKNEEVLDHSTGTVIETSLSMIAPSLSIRDEIHDKRYLRIRRYIIGRKQELRRAEQRRNEVRPSNYKPRRRRPAKVKASTVCPTCEGSGYARKGECPQCKGECWIVVS